MADAWDPAQYERFRDDRRKPFTDLMSMVRPRAGMRVVDLGCGTGELTRELHAALGAAETLGVDSSEAMLAKSAAFAGGGLAFERGDIATFARGGWDLVFSNAALQWVDDHARRLPAIAALLEAGGQLAVQIPANDDHVSHRTAAEIASEAPFKDALGGHVRTSPVLPPERYAEMLHALGFRGLDVVLRVYGVELPSPAGVVEWVKGTLLTDYRARLPADLQERFVAAYRERLLPRLGRADLPYFYAYKRILFRGTRR